MSSIHTFGLLPKASTYVDAATKSLYAIPMGNSRRLMRSHIRPIVPVVQPLGIGGNWNLIFEDTFNTLNTNVWKTLRRDDTTGSMPFTNINNEDAYYLPDNTTVEDGKLVLTMKPGPAGGLPYSSGVALSNRGFSYTYGFCESRIKVPSNWGTWPAFWIHPADESIWPPEMDVFEFWIDNEHAHRPYMNVHYSDGNGGYAQWGIKVYGDSNTDYTQDYHTYGFLWQADKMQAYCDGVAGPVFTDASKISNIPMMIIYNLALMKGYDPGGVTSMYVDYLRVWQ
jgi:beta-glucanase (GH16 family)